MIVRRHRRCADGVWRQSEHRAVDDPLEGEPEDDAARFLAAADTETNARSGIQLARELRLPLAKQLAEEALREASGTLNALTRYPTEEEAEVRIRIVHGVALPRTLLDESDEKDGGRGPLN
jgi:hypothetical protein